jgi:hypothetical protein
MNTDHEAKSIKLTLVEVNQRDIDAVLKRLASMKKRLRGDILFIGGHLAKMRDTISYGSWTSFVQRTFPLSVKTANIWIRAWEGRDTELAVNDWDGYMRALYGNDEPKKLKNSGRKSLQRDDDDVDDDVTQHGGARFHPAVFRDEDGRLSLSNLTTGLETELFCRSDITKGEKLSFIKNLISWLQAREKELSENDI